MAFSLPADLPTNWADDVGMVEDAEFLNAVGGMGNSLKAALNGMVNGTASAYVPTGESTSSATYTDLATTTDQVTVTIGPSGMALVLLHMGVVSSGFTAYMSYAVSGANTSAAADTKSLWYQCAVANVGGSFGSTFLETGLTAGSTTFKLKYRTASNATATFSYRRLTVIPFL